MQHEAFERFLDRHLHHVRAFLALKASVAHLVDELAHEAFAYAYRNVHEFTVGTSVRAWLRGIAWNLLRAEIHLFSREQANQANFAAQSICESVHAATDPCSTAEMDFLERCLEQVPTSMRQLLALKYRDDCSSEEIARQGRRLACPASA